jgi:N-acyl-D-amino-acid deacylase
MRNLFFAAMLLCGCATQRPVYDYDAIFRHARIVDGTGAPAFDGDVAIKNGRIAAVGQVTGSAAREIDAGGMVLAPGFIDVHTHAEGVLKHPDAENFLRMGVTTLVLGNCGSSELKVGPYFRKLEAEKISPNVATLVGHGTIRGKAMGGSFDRPPTAAEIARMKSLVGQAMSDGAVGMSTGLIYLPGTFATTEEIVELAKVIAPYGGIYTSHMRDEGEKITNSLEEVFRVAREAGVRAEVSHLKLSGPANWGNAAAVLELIGQARAEGLRITQDQYAYTASSTELAQLIPSEAREGGKFAKRISDPAQKQKIIADMKSQLKRRGSPDFSYAVIASCKSDPSLNGLNVAQAAKKRLGSDSLDNQIELTLQIEKAGGAAAVFHGMSEEDLECFMRNTNTMVAADSSVRIFGEAVPHPRGYGNNARILGQYVRKKKVLTLEDAIRKMTSLPAATFQFSERGQIRPGYWADLVVFDPEKVRDNATYNDPHHYATGFKYVLVNGVVVVEDDHKTGARPGMVLRHVPPKGV